MRPLLVIVLLVAACGGSGGSTSAPAPTSARAEPSAVASPEPTSVPEGYGEITFGTAIDDATLEIVKPITRFKRNFPEIAWSAVMTRPFGATSITWVIASQSKTGVEEYFVNEEIAVGNPEYQVTANSADLASMVENKVGTYVMRYIESGEILAEGTFELVK